MKKKQYLLAHRGYSAICPENTWLAFEMAYQFGFHGVELDIHLTKDGRLVIIHDDSTLRVSGYDKVIGYSTLHELRTLDLAATFKHRVRKQTILTLEEFLDLYLDKFELINVEIKMNPNAYNRIETTINAMSSKYGTRFFDKIVFSSFDLPTLINLKQLNQRYQIAYLISQPDQLSLDLKTKCNYLNPSYQMYNKHPKFFKSCRLPLMIWTIKSQKKYEDYLDDQLVRAQISNYKFA